MGRTYSSTAVKTNLSASITNSQTTITVDAMSGYPVSTPFVCAIDRGTAFEELVQVTVVVGTTLTVTRGFNGTTGLSHAAGAEFEHTFCALDFTDSSFHIGSSTGVHGVSGLLAGVSDTQTLTNKTLTTPTITSTGWANANHAHAASNSGGLLPTAAPAASAPGDSSVTGSATTYSRTDHVHARTTEGNFLGAWGSYTPTWTTTGTAPSLGNGTLTGAYMQIGKTVFFRLSWTSGSTTTYGTGSYIFSLPITLVNAGGIQTIVGQANDISAGKRYDIYHLVQPNTSTAGIFYRSDATQGEISAVTNLAPFTFANGDIITLSGVYEAA